MYTLHKKMHIMSGGFRGTAAVLLVCMLLSFMVSCAGKTPQASSGDTESAVAGAGESADAVSSETSESEAASAAALPVGVVDYTPEPLPATEPPKEAELPAEGSLKLKPEGAATIPDGFFQKPTLVCDGAVALLIEGTNAEKGLHIDSSTVLSYRIFTKAGEIVEEGSSRFDPTVCQALACENGYLGVAVPCGISFSKFDKYDVSVSFRDLNGASYTLENAELYYGLQYYGIDPALFDFTEDSIATKMGKSLITQTATIAGTAFTLTINLTSWDGNTKPAQIVTCARLFWYCYPRMYFRYGIDVGSPTKVTLAIENAGYEIASAGGSFVHIHDCWLKDHKTDYDCLTHEFAHVIQNGWDGNYCEYSGYIERFADYNRYVYAFNNGQYNDVGWALQTVDGEGELETSVRFLAWLDYHYSTREVDLINRYFHACYDKKYPSAQWDDAWKEITAGTELEGKTGKEIFRIYREDAFAKTPAGTSRRGGKSELVEKYDVRNKLRDRLF